MSNPASSYDAVAKKESNKAPFSSDRAAYRAYNNFVKAGLYRYVLQQPHPNNNSKASTPGLAVLDLASGRGGDLAKILLQGKNQKVPVTSYAALDISPESIAEAKKRMDGMKAKFSPQLQFILDVADVFDVAKTWKTHEALAAGRKYNVVSMQFALHYACSSAERLTGFLKAVSDVLEEDGFFVGTTVDCQSLSDIVRKNQQQQKQQEEEEEEKKTSASTSSSPSIFRVSVKQEDLEKVSFSSSSSSCLPLGVPYRFQLDELVDDVEYSIPFEVLVQEAAKYDLELVPEESKNLYDFRLGYIPSGDIRPELTPGDVELISFYLSFVFKKKKKTTSKEGEEGEEQQNKK